MGVPINIRFAAAGLWLCTLALPAYAETPNCAGVSETKERVACQAKVRRSYGASLEQTLLDLGPEAHVVVEEMGDPQSGAYPRLVIWPIIDKSTVTEVIDQAKILEGARKVGFRMIVFLDKELDNQWHFDLTRPSNVSLDVVPWQTMPWKRKN